MSRKKTSDTQVSALECEGSVLPSKSLDGTDWKSLIPKQYIVPNRKFFDNVSPDKLSELDITTLPDQKLLILLPGFRELAKIRGFKSIKYIFHACTPTFVACTCEIAWTDPENPNGVIVTSGCADASPYNTESYYREFLTCAAENRAFVRCVREYLGIYIVGKDEIGPENASIIEHGSMAESVNSNVSDPVFLLESKLREIGVSFDTFKQKIVEKGKFNNADSWASPKDIPPNFILSIIPKLKKGF